MKRCRRGRIIDLLTYGNTEKEILEILDKEFPSGIYKSSNKQSLAGTKWDLGITARKNLKKL